ncbi:MAG: 3-deoxy-D-manno-octulosonate 8-phosphate phosphatase, YrbI family [Ferruginibacter sp.]|nr:3-deoxy-D-manno-octulosonate 8-phosphate phosphatase, YrbI family [Ferruginibacter sp.]
MSVLQLFKPIKTFIFDVDGVLATEILVILQDGDMARNMNSKDGYALQLAVKKGYGVAIISGGSSEPVRQRLEKLGVRHVYLGIHNKKEKLLEYAEENNCKLEEMLYMGDDIPDYSVMNMVGLPCCPADAVQEIKQISKYISPIKGGKGCGRDVIEKVLKLNGHWDLDTSVASK